MSHYFKMMLAAVALLAVSAPAIAADTTPNQLSTEQRKIYLLPDNTWVEKTIVVDSTGADTQGVDATGVTPPTGGSGVRGWLSGIYNAVTGKVKVQGGAASGTAIADNPIPPGCYYSSASGITSQSSGSVIYFQCDASGNIRAQMTGSNGAPADTATTVNLCRAATTNSSTGIAPCGVLTYRWGAGGAVVYDRIASSAYHLPSSAATTNGASVKASACVLFGIDAANTTASLKYLKVYNKASAPTVGTDTPFVTIAIPASSTVSRMYPGGVYLGTGCAIALTGAAADNDTTALASGDVVALNVVYQ